MYMKNCLSLNHDFPNFYFHIVFLIFYFNIFSVLLACDVGESQACVTAQQSCLSSAGTNTTAVCGCYATSIQCTKTAACPTSTLKTACSALTCSNEQCGLSSGRQTGCSGRLTLGYPCLEEFATCNATATTDEERCMCHFEEHECAHNYFGGMYSDCPTTEGCSDMCDSKYCGGCYIDARKECYSTSGDACLHNALNNNGFTSYCVCLADFYGCMKPLNCPVIVADAQQTAERCTDFGCTVCSLDQVPDVPCNMTASLECSRNIGFGTAIGFSEDPAVVCPARKEARDCNLAINCQYSNRECEQDCGGSACCSRECDVVPSTTAAGDTGKDDDGTTTGSDDVTDSAHASSAAVFFILSIISLTVLV